MITMAWVKQKQKSHFVMAILLLTAFLYLGASAINGADDPVLLPDTSGEIDHPSEVSAWVKGNFQGKAHIDYHTEDGVYFRAYGEAALTKDQAEWRKVCVKVSIKTLGPDGSTIDSIKEPIPTCGPRQYAPDVSKPYKYWIQSDQYLVNSGCAILSFDATLPRKAIINTNYSFYSLSGALLKKGGGKTEISYGCFGET